MDKKTKKGIITTLIVGAIVFFGYKAFKSPKPSNTNSSGSNPPNTGSGSVLDFNGLANQLFDAFDGVGTKNDVWRMIINQLKNQSDWDSLSKAYGNKNITSFNFFTTCSNCNLVQSFKNELSTGELDQLNNILKSKGINTI